MLACARELDIDESSSRVNGGAIAIGHPLGASGVRLTLTLARELRRSGRRYGIASRVHRGRAGDCHAHRADGLNMLVVQRRVRIEWGRLRSRGNRLLPRHFEYFDISTVGLFRGARGYRKPELLKAFDSRLPGVVDVRSSFRIPSRVRR